MLKEKNIYKEDLPVNVVVARLEEYPIHFHDDMEVVYVLEGSVGLKNGYYNYVLKQGDIFILNDREIHSFTKTSEDNMVMMMQLNLDYFSKNKCAAELARTAAKYQSKWNPATVDGIKQPAVATFMIFPDDLFQNDKITYSPTMTYPRYGGFEKNHLDYFRKQLLVNVDVRRFGWNDLFTVEAEFIITKEGKMKDIILTKKTGLEEFDRMIFYAFKDMRKTWKPATVNGQPIDFRFKYQLTAITDPAD